MYYDKKLVRILSQICIDSYEGRYGTVKNVLPTVRVIEQDNVKAFIGDLRHRNKEYTVVVFPGSVGLADWIDNLKFYKVFPSQKKVFPFLGVGIHAGFYDQYLKICDFVWTELDLRRGEIIFTGHSLGGALATIFSYCHSFSHCYTFGAPGVGGRKFVSSFKRNRKITKYKSIRVVNGEDSICKAPPWWAGYKHVPHKVKIGQKLSWREMLLWPVRKVFGNPADHYPQRYLKNLK